MNNPRQRRRQLQTNIEKPQKQGVENTIGPQLKKIQLIQKLNQVIDNIGNTKNIGKCVEDSVIIELQQIEEEAKTYDFKEIIKMVNLAIGKRILNLELERKRTQIENKIMKKREIEEYFRENKIKKMQYEEIALQKLKHQSFIVKPYSDGKGFIESTIFYEKVISCLTGKSYQQYFEECQYLQTIKKINKIFFNNFSNTSSEESRKQAINNPILKLSLLLFLLILSFSLGLCLDSNHNTLFTFIIFILNLIAALALLGLAIWSFCHVKLANNQLEETVMHVSQYFEKINEQNKALGKRFEWICWPQFLYLQVQFHNEEESSMKSDRPAYSIKLMKQMR